MNKYITEDKDQMTTKNTAIENDCGASWQLFTNGSIGKLKCRLCGVYVVNGGTPKCLNSGNKISSQSNGSDSL